MPSITNYSRPDVPITYPRSHSHSLWTPHPPKEERIPTMIDLRIQHVRKLLWQALCKRFYDRYHPINGEAVSYFKSSLLYADNVKFSYVINMQVMLFLSLQNGELIDNMVQTLEIDDQDVPNSWLVQDLRKSFINLLNDYIWRFITRLTKMVAEGLIKDIQSNVICSSYPLAIDNEPTAKRSKTLTTISSILSCLRLDQPIAHVN